MLDFLSTARLLMAMQKDNPNLRYDFVDGNVVIRIPIQDNVPEMFSQAAKMFEPA